MYPLKSILLVLCIYFPVLLFGQMNDAYDSKPSKLSIGGEAGYNYGYWFYDAQGGKSPFPLFRHFNIYDTLLPMGNFKIFFEKKLGQKLSIQTGVNFHITGGTQSSEFHHNISKLKTFGIPVGLSFKPQLYPTRKIKFISQFNFIPSFVTKYIFEQYKYYPGFDFEYSKNNSLPNSIFVLFIELSSGVEYSLKKNSMLTFIFFTNFNTTPISGTNLSSYYYTLGFNIGYKKSIL